MVEWTMTVLKEGLFGGLGIIKTLAVIIIPLMILLQIMTDYHWLEKLSTKTKWLTDFLGVSKDALIPFLIGIFAGISYGAGAIIFAKEKYSLEKKDITLVMCFLLPFHAVPEMTLVFWIIGVNPVLTVVTRLTVAVTGTLLLKKYLSRR